MKRSSASITLVLISSAVALVACDRPSGFFPGSASDQSSEGVTTGSRTSGGGYHHPYYGGTGAWVGPRSSRWVGSSSGSRSAGVRGTTRGGFGSGARGFFGG